MATHHIGDLLITVRSVPGSAPREADVRAFATGVWEEVADTLERRHPGRVYRVRSWEGRWRVTRAALRRRPEVSLIAEVVAFCERHAPTPAGVDPDPAEPVVSFLDESERVAGWWLARAAGRSAHWAWRDLEQTSSVVDVLRGLGPAGTDAAVRCLVRAGSLEQALALLPDGSRRTVVGAVLDESQGAGAAPPRANGAAARPHRPSEPHAPARDDVEETEDSAASSVYADRALSDTVEDGVPPSTAVPSSQVITGSVDERWPQRPAGPGLRAPTAAERVTGVQRPVVWTGWGGLVYLLRPMLECRVIETLWEACLAEHAVLRRALSALSGEDPLAAALSGAETADGALVDADRLPEIRSRLVDGLRAAVPHRDLARWPAIELSEERAGTATLCARGLPWAVAAWPDGSTARDEAAALVEHNPDTAAHGATWLPAEPRPEDAALLAMVIGVPATLLGLRGGWSGGDADAFVDRWFRCPARLSDNGEVIEVWFGNKAVDVTLRRSGGDADPGWIPWLGRTVRLRFDAPEEPGSGD